MHAPPRRRALGALALLAALAAPGAAHAANPGDNNSVVLAGGVITVTADSAQADTVRLEQQDLDTIWVRTRGSSFPDANVTGCTPSPDGTTLRRIICDGLVTKVAVDTKDGIDTIQVFPIGAQQQTFQLDARGGDDNDTLIGGDFADILRGEGGNDNLRGDAGDDNLDGGADADVLRGEAGADDLIGGADFDTVHYFERPPTEPLKISIDDEADDGAEGEGDNVRTSVEDVLGGQGADHIVGSESANVLDGYSGNDVLEGAGGTDLFVGSTGSDRILAVDGNPERVDCGEDFPEGDTDDAIIDSADEEAGCEKVTRTDKVGGDPDGDGFKRPSDCEEGNPGVNPNAREIPENGIDENCDNVDGVITDRDGDGSNKDVDCDDNNPNAKPGGKEILGNAVDENCDLFAPPIPVVETGVGSKFDVRDGITYVEILNVGAMKARTTAIVRCKGGKRFGCPIKAKKKTVKRRSKGLNFIKYFRNARLRRGAVIEIQLTKPGYVGRLVRFRIKRRAVPTPQPLCIDPGEKRAKSC